MMREPAVARSACRILATGGPISTPFRRMITLDYVDGPVGGVAECSDCSRFYRFDMLVRSRDDDLRIFALRRVPRRVFVAVLQACKLLDRPKWPVWIPLWTSKDVELV